MKGLFKEKLEYYAVSFNSWEGIFEYLVSSLIWGYIIINYNQQIYGWIFNFLSFLGTSFIINYIAYIVFGVAMLPLGLLITFVLTKLFGIFFKNGRIIK